MTKTIDMKIFEGIGPFDIDSFLKSPQIDRREYKETTKNLRKYRAGNFGHNLDEGNIFYRAVKNGADFLFKRYKTNKAEEFFEHEKELKHKLKSYDKRASQYIDFYKNAFNECKNEFDNVGDDGFKLKKDYERKLKGLDSEDVVANNLTGIEKYFEKAKIKLKKFFLNGQYKVYNTNLGLKELDLNLRKISIERKYKKALKASIKIKSNLDKLDLYHNIYKTYLLKTRKLFK